MPWITCSSMVDGLFKGWWKWFVHLPRMSLLSVIGAPPVEWKGVMVVDVVPKTVFRPVKNTLVACWSA